MMMIMTIDHYQNQNIYHYDDHDDELDDDTDQN